MALREGLVGRASQMLMVRERRRSRHSTRLSIAEEVMVAMLTLASTSGRRGRFEGERMRESWIVSRIVRAFVNSVTCLAFTASLK